MKLRGERSIIARSKTWNYDNDAYKPRIFKYRLEERTYSANAFSPYLWFIITIMCYFISRVHSRYLY